MKNVGTPRFWENKIRNIIHHVATNHESLGWKES